MAKASFKGLDSLKRKLIMLKEDTAGYVRPVMEQGANAVVATAKNLAPVADRSRKVDDKIVNPGGLRDSIAWTYGAAPKGALTLASAKVGDIRITVYVGAWYGRLVEFGVRPHKAGGKFEGADHPGQAAQPFFFPAYRANKKKLQAALRKAIRDSVRKVAVK